MIKGTISDWVEAENQENRAGTLPEILESLTQ